MDYLTVYQKIHTWQDMQNLFYKLFHLKYHHKTRLQCTLLSSGEGSVWDFVTSRNVSQSFPFSFHELKSLAKFFFMTYALQYFIISCSVQDSIYNKWKTEMITLGFHSFWIFYGFICTKFPSVFQKASLEMHQIQLTVFNRHFVHVLTS